MDHHVAGAVLSGIGHDRAGVVGARIERDPVARTLAEIVDGIVAGRCRAVVPKRLGVMRGAERDRRRPRSRGALDRVARLTGFAAPDRLVAAAAGDRLAAQIRVDELVAAAAADDPIAGAANDRFVAAAAAVDRVDRLTGRAAEVPLVPAAAAGDRLAAHIPVDEFVAAAAAGDRVAAAAGDRLVAGAAAVDRVGRLTGCATPDRLAA